MHSSLTVRRIAALVLVLSVGLSFTSCKSTTDATSPAVTTASPKLTGEWASLPGDDTSVEPAGPPDSSGTLRGYLVGTSIFSTQRPGGPDSEAYRVAIRWGDIEANKMTDTTLSNSTEVLIDGAVVEDSTLPGKRAALDRAVARAESSGTACKTMVVYEPDPNANQDDPGLYPTPVLRRIVVETP